ncbi:hypothetical protein JAAARDRAFT_35180 [Jaapia argillacea MUCL 33604]|uniref:RING-type domain-containing protein n=1 Tax=Jaapia argillacea MUCL 33604 TaxID=933084 RepID=A0A067PRM6_9AGAM|nr:hypothetical protein JAAARDRAFT_35180 [Jaapia argillacea MUCL 33604]
MSLKSALVLSLGFLLSFLATCAQAYIPASPSNDTSHSYPGGPNVTDVSQLALSWYQGSYSQTVSYQLAGNGSEGISKGALVHFDEAMSWNNQTSTTPWIALVSCDFNATNMSMVDDIFTLARDRGAKAALLYSLYSQECIINADYTNTSAFDQVMDIFSTQSLTSAQLIEYQFSAINKTLYNDYNATILNASAAIINNSIATGSVIAPSYIFATLKAYNATGDAGVTNSTPPATSSGGGGGGSPNTGLAMIILYAITGCVSALFCVVIITGAIRAIRHPERYGPRGADFQGGYSQSRTQGLGRAILDTFPIIKFGTRTSTGGNQTGTGETADSAVSSIDGVPKDIEAQGRIEGQFESVEMTERRPTNQNRSADAQQPSPEEEEEETQPRASTSRPVPTRRPSRNAAPTNVEDVVPDAIGRETCPICILDFEEGDDLRVLPCEGKHKFHQHCVDPWLLELSSSCPLCRHDFHALETMMQGDPEDGPRAPFMDYDHPPPSRGSIVRFSRYVRNAIRRRRHREEAMQEDQTAEQDHHMQPPPEPEV